MIEERATAGICSQHTDWNNAGTQVCKVVDGVCCATRIRFGTAMAQNQNRRFARNARDFARSEFVEHEVADDANRLF